MSNTGKIRNVLWTGLLIVGVLAASRAVSTSTLLQAEPPSAESTNSGTLVADLSGRIDGIRREVVELRGSVDQLIEELRQKSAGEHPKPGASPSPVEKDGWELSLAEVIDIALGNSKVVRDLGGVLPFSTEDHAARRLAAINRDIGPESLGSGIRNLLLDINTAYWDTWLACKHLEVAKSHRDETQALWKVAHSRAERMDGEQEVQAREQYFFARAQVEQALQDSFEHDYRLRFLMGISGTDNRMIVPNDEPTVNKPKLAARRTNDSPAVVRQRRRVEELRRDIESMSQLTEQKETKVSRDLTLRREMARLNGRKLNAQRRLHTAIGAVDFAYNSSATHFNRMKAAQEETETLLVMFQGRLTEIDRVLDAQRRRSQATSDYHQAQAEFEKAMAEYRFRAGTLLEHHDLELVTEENADSTKDDSQ